jgi:hypothetical protein
MSKLWQRALIEWKTPTSYTSVLSRWLRHWLNDKGIRHLMRMSNQDLCSDDGAGHYLLYGSEWMQCILGFDAHPALRAWGAPTVVLVDLPLSLVTSGTRGELLACSSRNGHGSRSIGPTGCRSRTSRSLCAAPFLRT